MVNVQSINNYVFALMLFSILICASYSSPVLSAPYQSLELYLDADQTHTRQAGQSILKGIQLALSEVDYKIQGMPVKVSIKNHKGSSPRSLRHLKQYLTDDNALAVISGLHSPPLLAHRNFINHHGILVLNPWAAASPITRSKTKNNWIFRLSVDDKKAGNVITQYAINHEGYSKPYLLLEDTGWGRSNLTTFIYALEQRNVQPAGLHWFNWGLGKAEAKVVLQQIQASGADVVFLVANAPEAITLINTMLSLPTELHLPLRSHWGITGGNFAQQLGDKLTQLDLAFIQTKFSFMNQTLSDFQSNVLIKAIELFPDIERAEDIEAPTGLIHSYDIVRLMLNAANNMQFSGDITQDRLRLRTSLEQQKGKVQGLIKNYSKPFYPHRINKPDNHEALNEEDLTMGYFDQQGVIHLRATP